MKQNLGQLASLTIVGLFLVGAGFNFFAERQMTQSGYVALGILLAAATLWITEAVPLFVTSLFVLFLSVIWLAPTIRADGGEVENTEFLAPFFSDIILLFLGGFVLSAALHKLHLDEWLARRIIKRTGSSLPKLMIGVMAVTAFLSMWLSNTATAAMMLAMILPIVNHLPEGDPGRKALLLSVPFAANVGGLGTPVGSPPNAIAMQYMRQAGIEPGFGTWMLIGIPGVVIMLLLTWVVLMAIYRGGKSSVPMQVSNIAIPNSLSVWTVSGVALLTAVGWMTTTVHGHTAGTVAMIPMLAFFATGILDTADLRGLSWEVLLMMGGGLCLGSAISLSGLADWLVGLIPLEGVSVFWLTVIFGSVACLMSSLVSNTATANLVLPIILGLNMDSLSPMMIGTAFGCSLAMPLPVSTPPNAMAFSSGLIRVGDMVKPGLLLTLMGLILAFTTGYWWWKFVGLW